MNVNAYKVLNKLITGILIFFLKQFHIVRLSLYAYFNNYCTLPIDRAELYYTVSILDFQLDRLSPLITGQGSGFAPNNGWSGKKAHHTYNYYFCFYKRSEGVHVHSD